jgi:hypothetical protein
MSRVNVLGLRVRFIVKIIGLEGYKVLCLELKFNYRVLRFVL